MAKLACHSPHTNFYPIFNFEAMSFLSDRCVCALLASEDELWKTEKLSYRAVSMSLLSTWPYIMIFKDSQTVKNALLIKQCSATVSKCEHFL